MEHVNRIGRRLEKIVINRDWLVPEQIYLFIPEIFIYVSNGLLLMMPYISSSDVKKKCDPPLRPPPTGNISPTLQYRVMSSEQCPHYGKFSRNMGEGEHVYTGLEEMTWNFDFIR